jgi:hypothetical protein
MPPWGSFSLVTIIAQNEGISNPFHSQMPAHATGHAHKLEVAKNGNA